MVNNAGISQKVDFENLQEADWDLMMKVCLKGMFSVTNAAWGYMREQGYGRIVNTTSITGLYGTKGSSHYATSKMAVHGFAQTLALEGAKRNIIANSIAPGGFTRMAVNMRFMEKLKHGLDPKLTAPLVAFLCHESCKETGKIFETSAGWSAALRWQRS